MCIFTFGWEFFCLLKCPKSQESVYYCLVITLWKCEYCLIWVLNKSKLFSSNSLKLSLLCDMYSEKRFYYSLIWVELSENVSIAWHKLCSIAYQWLSKNVSIVWYREKCVVLFRSNSMKVSILFDMKSETCLLLLIVIAWKCEYFLNFWLNVLLLYALGFHARIFWPLG